MRQWRMAQPKTRRPSLVYLSFLTAQTATACDPQECAAGFVIVNAVARVAGLTSGHTRPVICVGHLPCSVDLVTDLKVKL